FTAAFFKKAWKVIGNDFCKAVKEFFRSGRMLGEINATLISLIPKVDTPNKVTEFRPIACCNVLYKCISKELMKGYNRKGGPKRVAIKIDLQKAYDTGLPSMLIEIELATLREEKDLGKLVHVCFADDLLVMCHGDSYSVKVIKSALDEFSTCSGLLPNNSKSIVFFGSLNEEEKSNILNEIPFIVGKLPVRPKDQGGLGLKDLHIWNQALLAKHVWNLATKKDTLWVKWVHSVKLKGKSIWEIDADINDSWGWKNLLSIRALIRNNVRYIIGNGKNTSMWFDNWCRLSPLSQIVTYRDLYDDRLSSDLSVSDMICNEQWRWPIEWMERFPMITNLDVPAINTDNDDKIVWRTKKGRDLNFSVSMVNTDLNDQAPVIV
ncbi:hypothetical protein Tco_1512930, partial [Tanacetum coccineum]